MREKQPRLLVIWGKYDLSFDPGERNAIVRTYRKLKSTFLTQVILHWTRPQMKSPRWCETLWVLHTESCRPLKEKEV